VVERFIECAREVAGSQCGSKNPVTNLVGPALPWAKDIDVWTEGVALPARRRDRRKVLSSSGSGSILS
jgi:hypothetical protein